MREPHAGDALVVGAPVPATGRYAVQGAQMRAGIELWARRAGARLILRDDESHPERAAELHGELIARGVTFALGPYGSDCARAVAAARTGAVIWNHGAAADDVQRLPGVVSVPSPASEYLVALGAAVAALRPGAKVAVVAGRGPLARFARQGLDRAAPALGLHLADGFSFEDEPAAIACASAGAILLCGPLQREIPLLGALLRLAPSALLGGLSAGLAAFPSLLGTDPEGLLAPVQWHPELGEEPDLGPASTEVQADARAAALGELDYVAAQVYSAALIAARCLELAPENPHQAARRLRVSTFFGQFALDPISGVQRGHRMTVVRWEGGRRALVS